jgi:hypothetical protein
MERVSGRNCQDGSSTTIATTPRPTTPGVVNKSNSLWHWLLKCDAQEAAQYPPLINGVLPVQKATKGASMEQLFRPKLTTTNLGNACPGQSTTLKLGTANVPTLNLADMRDKDGKQYGLVQTGSITEL